VGVGLLMLIILGGNFVRTRDQVFSVR
jgi:hypothetical protein